MRRLKIGIGRKDLVHIGGGLFHDCGILIDIGQHKAELSALPLAEQVPGTAQFKVLLRYFESVICLFQDLQPFRFAGGSAFFRAAGVEKNTVGLPLSSPYAPPELMGTSIPTSMTVVETRISV